VKPLWVVVILALAGASIAAEKKPDVEVREVSAHRVDTLISIDGRIRNTGAKPLKELILLFNFLAPGKVPITTQKIQIDEDLLERGQEVPFHVELNAPPRSVELTIDAMESAGRELRVGKPGPYPID
jgi:hypothetical protein